MLHQAADAETLDNTLVKHAMRSESRDKLKAMCELAQDQVAVEVDDLDFSPWHLNCENGTVDLRNGSLRAHNPVDNITLLAPVEYDPDAKAPTFVAFLKRILPDREIR